MRVIHDDNQLIAQASHSRYLIFSMTAALYFISAVYCIYISRQPGSIASIWYGNTIVIISLQMLAYRDWGILLVLAALANLAANMIFHDPLILSLSFIPGNLAEIALGGYFLRRFIPIKEISDSPMALLKMFSIMLIPIVVSSLIGASVMAIQGISVFTTAGILLFMGSAAGMVSILPLGILILTSGFSAITQLTHAFNFFISFLIAVLTALYSFVYLPDPYVYISATMIIVALTGRFVGTAIAVLVYSLIIGSLISFGFFSPTMQGAYASGESFLYLPLMMTLLQPLLLATAMERINKGSWHFDL